MLYHVDEARNVFSFETATGNKISVEFTDYTDTFGSEFPVYCVDILRQVLSKKHANELTGSATRDTIVSIIRQFFERYDCALFAFMDTSTDKKGRARNRLFKSWFNALKDEGFILEPRQIVASGAESYSLLIIRKFYGNSSMIIDAFDAFIQLANSS